MSVVLAVIGSLLIGNGHPGWGTFVAVAAICTWIEERTTSREER